MTFALVSLEVFVFVFVVEMVWGRMPFTWGNVLFHLGLWGQLAGLWALGKRMPRS